MRKEEDTHRHRLVELFRRKYGEEIPLIAAAGRAGLCPPRPAAIACALGRAAVRRQVALMELETQRFYTRAAELTTDAEMRQLLGDLAEAERRHEVAFRPVRSGPSAARANSRRKRTPARQLFVLQVIQPGLVGLMDGSVSTLAPLFAAAFATPRDLADVPGRPGRLGWRGHQHGLRRGPVRRRQPDRPRTSVSARRDLRTR